MKKPVSIKDIAAALHVSLATVHKALTGKPGISDARRKEILAAAEKMGYTVNPAAQTLSRKNRHIGVIFPAVWHEFFADMKEGMDAELFSLQNYKVTGLSYTIPATPSQGEAENIRQWLRDAAIDAVLYCASHFAYDDIATQALQNCGLPVFWVGGGSENPLHAPSITVDATLAGKMAADFLCCTARKPVKAAVFLGSLKNDIHKAKAEAFCRRITENGGDILCICETEDIPEKAYEAMDKHYQAHPELNAIFVCTATSQPICAYMKEHGLQEQIALIGTDVFDSLRESVRSGIMKATIFQHQKEVGRLAAASAYEYLTRHQSYGYAHWQPEPLLLVKPSLFLKANLE
jgi:LacI family transcriptional regulator